MHLNTHRCLKLHKHLVLRPVLGVLIQTLDCIASWLLIPQHHHLRYITSFIRGIRNVVTHDTLPCACRHLSKGRRRHDGPVILSTDIDITPFLLQSPAVFRGNRTRFTVQHKQTNKHLFAEKNGNREKTHVRYVQTFANKDTCTIKHMQDALWLSFGINNSTCLSIILRYDFCSKKNIACVQCRYETTSPLRTPSSRIHSGEVRSLWTLFFDLNFVNFNLNKIKLIKFKNVDPDWLTDIKAAFELLWIFANCIF